MNKVESTFKLTKEGKLPSRSNMECEKHGIYAFLHKGSVIRFGESASGFDRIRKGFNHQLRKANGKKNYLAYHFREGFKDEEIEVRYYSVNRLLDLPEERRAIEAELAYQFRVKTGAWPRVMVEIHFSNNMCKNSTIFVNRVLEDLCI
ncbi:hypothetical protein ACJJIQ_02770 [Microbulbifer sp. ANSA003]|uniref:hypothetical protein n=1 Tax=unclassified Microbulbifer TaxID=2619833 RepID=UPI00403A6BA5